MKKKAILSLIACSAVLIVGCSSSNKSEPTAKIKNGSWTTQKLLMASKDAAAASMDEKNRGKAKDLAVDGIDFAERCLMRDPENAGCYYWRAVSTGLYYKIRVIGYQDGIRQMIADCKKVIEIDPSYDSGGAYRMLGQIYTKLPQTGVRPDSITRDLPLAEDYLRQAVRQASYPENYLALAETLLEERKIPEAIEALAEAKSNAPHWKNDIAYNDWTKEMNGLEKKIARVTK